MIPLAQPPIVTLPEQGMPQSSGVHGVQLSQLHRAKCLTAPCSVGKNAN